MPLIAFAITSSVLILLLIIIILYIIILPQHCLYYDFVCKLNECECQIVQ